MIEKKGGGVRIVIEVPKGIDESRLKEIDEKMKWMFAVEAGLLGRKQEEVFYERIMRDAIRKGLAVVPLWLTKSKMEQMLGKEITHKEWNEKRGRVQELLLEGMLEKVWDDVEKEFKEEELLILEL